MRVAWIEVRDFRSHHEVTLELPPGLTAVVGPNARGKTNLLEAIYYLCALVSPRVSSDLPLVRWGSDSAFLRGEVESARGRFLIEVEVRVGGANRVHVNRTPVRRKRDLRRDVRAVFSGPDDLAVVLGDPQERRRFMDEVGAGLWPPRESAVTAYDKVLRQRNRLLKDWGGVGEPAGLDAWDAELMAQGSALTEVRAESVERISGRAVQEFAVLTGQAGEVLVVSYRPSVGGVGEELREAFRRRLAERREDELLRRTTLVGPHRDDLGLDVQGLAARGFASHGEAWGAALSLRLAMAGAIGQELLDPPVLFLDDPFSGLDPVRRARLAGGLAGRGQTLLAVPDELHVPPDAVVWCAREDGIGPA